MRRCRWLLEAEGTRAYCDGRNRLLSPGSVNRGTRPTCSSYIFKTGRRSQIAVVVTNVASTREKKEQRTIRDMTLNLHGCRLYYTEVSVQSKLPYQGRTLSRLYSSIFQAFEQPMMSSACRAALSAEILPVNVFCQVFDEHMGKAGR